MATFPSPTTGIGVAAQILVAGTENSGDTTPGYNDVVISLSGNNGPENFQLNPTIVDVAGTPVELGTAFVVASVAASAAQFTETLSAAAAASNGTTAYTTSSSPVAGSLVGQSFVVTGFATNASNNGTFLCTANTTSTITLDNPNGIAETHAATATSTPKVATYTGTFTSQTTGSLIGKTVVIAGFVTNTVNNGSFIVLANSGTTTITVDNAVAVSESHAATATVQESATALTYFKDGSASYVGGTSPIPTGATGVPVVLVSADGLITTNGVTGGSVVEVSFPAFNNGSGSTGAISPNPMTGLPLNKIYAEVNVTVVE